MPNAKGYWNYLVLGFFGTSLGGFHPRVGARCYLPNWPPSFWVIEWVQFYLPCESWPSKFKISAFGNQLSAETGQFRQLIWFSRMTLAAENISMCKNQRLLRTHQVIKRAYCNCRKGRLMVHCLLIIIVDWEIVAETFWYSRAVMEFDCEEHTN